MPTPFGPQLIGETEKTLNALLREVLAGRLTEPEWVTLRLAHVLADEVRGTAQLVAAVSDRARFEDSAGVVHGLVAAGLLEDGRPTGRARTLVADLQSQVAARTASLWSGLSADDVEAAERVLNEVRDRARAQLAAR